MTKDFGIHEKVELLGQSFDIQTELVELVTETVRTVIFHNGEVAAHREARLSKPGESDGEDLEARLREHHSRALEQFVERSLGFEARSAGAELELDTLPVTSLGEAEEASEMPPIPEDPALADAIEVRQLVATLLSRLGLAPLDSNSPSGTTQGWRAWIGHLGRRLRAGSRSPARATRIEEARQALSWAMEQSSYRHVRMEEQVLFQLLRERIDTWCSSDRSEQEADDLWQEVVALCDYFREINLRSDLVEFDRKLLDWALAAFERQDTKASVRRPLRWILGRDPKLDALLKNHETSDDESLQAELERVRATISL